MILSKIASTKTVMSMTRLLMSLAPFARSAHGLEDSLIHDLASMGDEGAFGDLVFRQRATLVVQQKAVRAQERLRLPGDLGQPPYGAGDDEVAALAADTA